MEKAAAEFKVSGHEAAGGEAMTSIRNVLCRGALACCVRTTQTAQAAPAFASQFPPTKGQGLIDLIERT
jgi:hypothetical protein